MDPTLVPGRRIALTEPLNPSIRAPALNPGGAAGKQGYRCDPPESTQSPPPPPPPSPPSHRGPARRSRARGRERGLRIMWHVAPDPGSCPANRREQRRTRSFFAPGPAPETAHRLREGQEPTGDDSSHRDLSRRTGYPHVNFLLTEESVVGHHRMDRSRPGCGAARQYAESRTGDHRASSSTCVIGVAGALLGAAGWPPGCSTSTPCTGSSTCRPG